jgi:hypothetical protein
MEDAMKNLPLWTKTLAVASLALFGAAACDDGAQVENTAGIEGEQQESGYVEERSLADGDQEDADIAVRRENGLGQLENEDQLDDETTLQEQEVETYGQQGTTAGQQTNEQDQIRETDDETVAQQR